MANKEHQTEVLLNSLLSNISNCFNFKKLDNANIPVEIVIVIINKYEITNPKLILEGFKNNNPPSEEDEIAEAKKNNSPPLSISIQFVFI
jgi:hypothetical protein